MRYEDYVDVGYKPAKSDLVCDFYLEPAEGVSAQRAIGAVAAESSIGTWTELTTEKPYMEKLAAIVFETRQQGKGYSARIAYPIGLFEPGNMPNIMSSVAGNIFGMKEVKHLRMEQMHFPKQLAKSFAGPKHGIAGVRKIFKRKGPLVGTIVKPKLGLKSSDHAKVAYEAWAGGCDVVKDDENLSSQSFNRFAARLATTLKYKRKAEKETGEHKGYMINVTAETLEMLRRTKLAKDAGNDYIMTDIITCGWSAMQTLRENSRGLVIHAHRAGHGAFTKLGYHGIAMPVIATAIRLIGVDQLHVGTGVGKMAETPDEVRANIRACTAPMHGVKPVMPVASGGLNPCHVPALLGIFGKDVIIQMGGGIHGHPRGTRVGAKAARDAIDAAVAGERLRGYSKELDEAISKWGN